MKNFGMDERKQYTGTTSSSKTGHEFHELTLIDSHPNEVRDNSCNSCLKSTHGGIQKRASSDRHHWRQRPVSNGRSPRRHRTQDQYAVWVAIRHARRWNAERAPDLFFATTRTRPPDSAARNKS